MSKEAHEERRKKNNKVSEDRTAFLYSDALKFG
jgi:hypothetical protein